MTLHCIRSSLYKAADFASFGVLPTLASGVSSSIWLLSRSISIHRLFSYATETAEGIERDPPTFAAGVLLNLGCGDTISVKVAAKVALLACTIIDVSDRYNDFKKAWQDLSSIGENIPIEFIKQYCSKLDVNKRTFSTHVICKSPGFLAKGFVKCTDTAHYTARFTKAFFSLIEAGIRFYYAVHTDELAGIHERNRLFINIKKIYSRLCENPAETCDKLKGSSKTIDKILRAANTSFRSEDLIQYVLPKMENRTKTVQISKERDVHTLFSNIAYIGRRASFAVLELFGGFGKYVAAKDDLLPPQPILERGPAHGNDYNSHAPRKAIEKPQLGRFYKTSQ